MLPTRDTQDHVKRNPKEKSRITALQPPTGRLEQGSKMSQSAREIIGSIPRPPGFSAWAKELRRMKPTTRYMLRRNAASVMKIVYTVACSWG